MAVKHWRMVAGVAVVAVVNPWPARMLSARDVVRHRGQNQSGTVRPEPSGGYLEVGQPAVLPRGDGLFHDDVPAVVGLDRDQLTGPVGEERVVAMQRQRPAHRRGILRRSGRSGGTGR